VAHVELGQVRVEGDACEVVAFVGLDGGLGGFGHVVGPGLLEIAAGVFA